MKRPDGIHILGIGASVVGCFALSLRLSLAQQTATQSAKAAGIAVRSTTPVFVESIEGSKRLRSDPAGNLYLLNIKDSSVLVYNKSLTLSRRVGSYGQGPDDLRLPFDFAVDRLGRLIIADTDNNRIQIMSPQGRQVGSFKVQRPLSVDVLTTGEILVVDSAENHLVSVFSLEGRLLRTFGDQTATGIEVDFPALHNWLNRGRLLVDGRDNILWVGNRLPVPTVRKYSPQGRLLLEFHPDSKLLQGVIAKAQERLREKVEAQHELGAVETLHGVRPDSNGDIWVFPAAPQILIYDGTGNFKREVRPTAGIYPMGAEDGMIIDNSQFILCNSVIGCFEFKVTSSRTYRGTDPMRRR